MQITLVQAEIETAIRNYINNQIKINDGMRIDIDLAATRGADGFKATIDIVPDNAPPVQKQAEVAATPVAAKAAVVKEAEPKKEEAKKEAAPVEAKAETKADVAEAKKEDVPAEAQQATAAASDAEEIPAQKPSLFANLKKPTNQ